MAAIYDILEQRADDLTGPDLEAAYRVVLSQNKVLHSELDAALDQNRKLKFIAMYVRKQLPDYYQRIVEDALYPTCDSTRRSDQP